ncbi:non-homologous end-joining DNA ligase [Pseudonocardia acidicola]|uniref:DNA ligase (ATP) n=1 Tax=Pseudonocardia acidicola TaxID=2724939 RepID=A0ABX1S6Y3_9PSEU|nr:non-homologous end-joining DNA ligase [Pseudonocardia acidicola]NMH96372.1 ATP-dependent DNA ligase [Pseudonocardia acidicola]
MLATLTDEHFSDPGWIYERKFDGVRAIVVRRDGRTELYSRNRKDMTGTYPELAEALDGQDLPDLVADGEVVAFDDGRTSFERLQARLGLTDPQRARETGVTVYLYLFDLLAFDGADLTEVPLRGRKRVLRRALHWDDPVRFTTHRNGDGERYLDYACAHGWEGVIAKRADSPYRPGRTKDWLKFKCVRDQELVIGGWTDPGGARKEFGALLVGYHPTAGDTRLRYAGKVGTGFTEATLHALRERFAGLDRADSPFDRPVRERGAHWLAPELVAQIGFTEWTRDGRLRHPRYLGLRDDKPATEVVREG